MIFRCTQKIMSTVLAALAERMPSAMQSVLSHPKTTATCAHWNVSSGAESSGKKLKDSITLRRRLPEHTIKRHNSGLIKVSKGIHRIADPRKEAVEAEEAEEVHGVVDFGIDLVQGELSRIG